MPRPSVNSHYGRQTIWWAIPLALTGQRFDARRRTLELHPHPSLGSRWPLVLPCGGALATEEGAGACITLRRLTGQCDYRAWRVSRRGVALFARRRRA